MFLTRENIFWKVKNGWAAVKTNWLIFFNALMSKHIWPTEIVRGTRSNDLDGFFLCAYVIHNLKIFILRQSMPVYLENKKLFPKSFIAKTAFIMKKSISYHSRRNIQRFQSSIACSEAQTSLNFERDGVLALKSTSELIRHFAILQVIIQIGFSLQLF